MWRQPVDSYFAENLGGRYPGCLGLRVFRSGVRRGYPGAPLPRAPLCKLEAWGCVPITCSSRHLTSHLSYSYISIHSVRSQWPFPCVFSVDSGYEPGVLIQRESRGKDRDSHYIFNFSFSKQFFTFHSQ